VSGAGAERREIGCRLVVGADGLRSVVVRRLGLLRRPPRLRKLALTAHVTGMGRLEDGGELHVAPWGTIGIAPIGAGACNVTLVLPEREAGVVAGAKEEYFDRVLATCSRLRGARREDMVLATGPFDWPVRAAVVDGAALVGDAAGYFDPFTGQGIYRALRGAALLAGTATDALRAGDLSALALQPYEQARRRAFGPGTRLQRLIELFLARPALMRVAGDRFHRRPSLAHALVAVTGDLEPVRTLWAPRTLARLLA
jgi:flavin-dependent dehydrogenase